MNTLKKGNTDFRTYAVAVAIPLAVGILSALLTKNNMDIYAELNSPPLSPPSFLFPVVWTVLYVLMGISSALIWKRRSQSISAADTGLGVYALCLAFNFAWSIIFFNMRAFAFSFLWLTALILLIVLTIIFYRKVSPAAAYLQIPYLIWCSFAWSLNLGIWILNT